jgi:hypothetical protein
MAEHKTIDECKQAVRTWLEKAKRTNAAVMLVFLDMTGSSGRNLLAYPIYMKPGEDVAACVKSVTANRQFKAAEYDLSGDLERQIEEKTGWMQEISYLDV